MDGGNRIVGTEFVKMLITGSSNLATEEYVDDKVAEGGGGGNVDLSNYYTQTETDNLLNAKLNVNNPQDITGNLRLDPTNGNSKIILNAVAPATASDDFYCNGNGQFDGSLRVSILTSDGDVNCDGVNADTFNSNVITNDIVFNHNDNEYLRFQVSDNTVRVPNTRSFLSQDIYLDNLRPLTFSNDVVLYGGNNANDAYEEYVRLNASTERVNFSKIIDINEDLIMKQTKVLYLDATANLQRYITTRNDNGQDILELVNNKATNNQIRFTNNGSTSLIVDNSFVFSSRQIQGNNGLKVDFIDTRNTNVDFHFRRSGATAITLKADNEVQFSGYIFVNNISTPENTDLAIRRSGTELIRLNSSNQIQLSGALLVNIINSNGNATLNIQQNGNSFISLLGDALNRVQINRFLRVVDGGGSTQAQFVQSTNGNYMEIRLGNHINAYATGTPVSGNTIHLNYYSHGNVFLGTNQDTSPDNPPTITINKFSSDTGNAFEVQGDSVFSGTVSTNTLNSETGDLVFQRLGTEIFKCETSAGIDNNNIINVSATGGGVSAVNVYGNSFKNRTLTSDTVFYGANSAGDNRVEYMKWNRTDQSLDFNAPIDNTNIAVIGNIVDTTVSDERLKTNIQDVESNYCDCVKNVKIKTFKYKDEKYKDSDKYGFIAQHLQKHLPKEFDNIVKETKPKKDEGEAYLSINYMKLSVVLWGALQETLNKVEHLEASVYELQNGVKKVKPKAKSKSKNVD